MRFFFFGVVLASATLFAAGCQSSTVQRTAPTSVAPLEQPKSAPVIPPEAKSIPRPY